ncbi:alpha/beta fold hydrolase [Nocardia transvalensis]|uniref:alpha/beta fold hydrolase n=1 Tax=Nocardia transvalensis TaxID=37333 RepID=UPI001893FF15|nr:alpha/beta hydrolase [Nocardia transvalensis]MBF6329572.1 alpha/beta hydrolase [Nocardia transvalensis]
MTEEKACGVGPSHIELAYERFGDPSRPPVLLITGVGAQMIDWPEGFCAELVERGLHVIRFDNRDTGRSTRLSAAPIPDLGKAMGGDLSTVPYTLSDMAADTVGLLDALGIDSAHLVGASLGAMIAQTVAIEYPGRVRSLTSMMATTGDPGVGRTDPALLGASGAPPTDRAGYIAWQVRFARPFAGPGFAFDEAEVAERAARAYDRGRDDGAMARQLVAVLASGDRTALLRTLRVPTLVVHGTADVMFDVSGATATAAAIPGAKLVVIDGMGHSLPRELWSTIAGHIAALVRDAEDTARRE